MKPSERLAAHRERVIEILNARGFSKPRLFGSVAYGQDTEASDLDILIEAPPGTSLFHLAAAEIQLAHVLGCEVEILTEGFLAPDVRIRMADESVPLR